MSVTEREYPLITYSDLMDDMLTDKRVHDSIQCCQIHLFGFYEEFFELGKCERSTSLELLQDMASMDSRKHISKFYVYNIKFAYFCKCKFMNLLDHKKSSSKRGDYI